MSPGRLLPIALALLMVAAAPAVAQRAQQTQRATPAPPVLNNDLRLQTALNVEYRIDANWSFHLDTELRLDDNISRLRDFEVRPGFEYQFSRN